MVVNLTGQRGGDGSSGGQYGLFGDPVPVLPEQRRPAESNNVDLMVTVAANAARCGYLLVGASERVYTRTDADDRVARVPRYEEDAVHQLLRRRWLTLGSTHPITCGAARLIGTAVLVPKATRERTERWEQLQRPPSWPRPPGTGQEQPAPRAGQVIGLDTYRRTR